mgnify:CR=1 FL=1
MSSPCLRTRTSGWVYDHWEGIFYPVNLKNKDKLKYFSQQFKTTEVNYSFYHLPRATTYQNWYKMTPKGFVFAVKVSRLITHIKKLKGVETSWKVFLENAVNLKEKLGPFLFQFPPSFKATRENIKRLEKFSNFIRKNSCSNSRKLMDPRLACEFRHKSWCDNEIYNILKKYNIAWVVADSPSFPKEEKITANFAYVRMHGSRILFSSKYTDKELKDLAQKIKEWLKQYLDVYIYFNNDTQGFAVLNAKRLLALCENRK